MYLEKLCSANAAARPFLWIKFEKIELGTVLLIPENSISL